MCARSSRLMLILLLIPITASLSGIAWACSYPSTGHTQETAGSDVHGNDCKWGDTNVVAVSESSCSDSRYDFYDQTEDHYLTNITHSEACTSPGCQPCGVITGTKVCAMLKTQARRRFHSLWDRWNSYYAYSHTWHTTPHLWTSCNCGNHGCTNI